MNKPEPPPLRFLRGQDYRKTILVFAVGALSVPASIYLWHYFGIDIYVEKHIVDIFRFGLGAGASTLMGLLALNIVYPPKPRVSGRPPDR